MGSLIKILEGPKEELIDVDVNSLRNSVLISVASLTAISHCRRLGQWHDHVPQHLQLVGAIQARGFLEGRRQAYKIGAQEEHGERRVDGDVDDGQAG